MVSYVDILTLILIFFVVAAARSLAVPPTRAMIPVKPSTAHTAIPIPPSIAQTEPEQPRTNLIRAQNRLKEQELEPKLEAQGLVISLPQVALFSPGADAVSPQALATIGQIAEAIRDIPNEVRLVGHADTVPIHNHRFHSNWELSMARSQKILELLSTRFGISESRLSIASYGPYRPAAPNDTEDGRASNRRVEIVILDEPVGTSSSRVIAARTSGAGE